MRASFLLCVLCSLVSGAHSQTTTPEIAPLREPYLKSLASIRATRDQRTAPITSTYIAALDRLEKQFAADPVAAAPVKAERERVAAQHEPLEIERKEMPPALAELRARYEKDRERANAPFLQQEQQLTRQYLVALDGLQRRLTAQNQMVRAAAVRAEHLAAAATLPKELAAKDTDAKVPAESTIRASTVKAVGALDPALAEKIAAAVSAKTYNRSENSKQEGTTTGWADVPEEGGLLVGFEFFEVGKEQWIRSLRPYFMTKQGIVAGKDRGKMEKVTSKIVARPGYAVAGLFTSGGNRSIQVVFMKIDPATGRFATDAASTYKSTWFGDKSREKPKQIGCDGHFAIGVYGKTGANSDDLGLVLMN